MLILLQSVCSYTRNSITLPYLTAMSSRSVNGFHTLSFLAPPACKTMRKDDKCFRLLSPIHSKVAGEWSVRRSVLDRTLDAAGWACCDA